MEALGLVINKCIINTTMTGIKQPFVCVKERYVLLVWYGICNKSFWKSKDFPFEIMSVHQPNQIPSQGLCCKGMLKHMNPIKWEDIVTMRFQFLPLFNHIVKNLTTAAWFLIKTHYLNQLHVWPEDQKEWIQWAIWIVLAREKPTNKQGPLHNIIIIMCPSDPTVDWKTQYMPLQLGKSLVPFCHLWNCH